LALNVAMDLEPYQRINPCGFDALEITQLSALCGVNSLQRVQQDLESEFREKLA
jgi:lipoyl(octanoyl) transferase